MALPVTPSNFYVTQGNGQIYVQWTLVPGATSYNVLVSTNYGLSYTTLANVTTPNYLFTNPVLGTIYYFQVQSVSTAISTSVFLTGNTSLPLASVVGFQSGMTLTDTTTPANIGANTIISAVGTTTITINPPGALGNSASAPGDTLVGMGVSAPTTAQVIVPTMGGEMCLAELMVRSRQRADRLYSNFVTLPEIQSYINQSMYELYDLLIDVYEDYFKAPAAMFYTTGGIQSYYPVPDGVLTFLNWDLQTTFVPRPIYKLLGLDMGLNSINNGWVTVDKFNYTDRNRYFYPTPGGVIYGVFNCQYRWMGKFLELIPIPPGQQPFRIQYIPRLTELLQPNDITDTSISGWLEYVITDVAIKILQKEESPIDVLVMQKEALRQRIMSSSNNKDAGRSDTINDTRNYNGWGDRGYGGGFHGGF